MTKYTSKIKTPQPAYIFEYPQFAELADKQLSVFWPWNEIKVEKDKQELLTGLTPAEYHGVLTTLKLFTHYELFVGTEYWLGRVMTKYQRADIQRMAACFGHVELNSHAPFYNKLNEALGLANEEFYNSYVNDETLRERMEFIESLISDPDDCLSLAGFTFIEGAVLYSAFAYLKHFQSNGKNKITNTVRGINMSVRDENLHAIGGAQLFRTTLDEENRPASALKRLHKKIYACAQKVYEHEARIIEMIFERGDVEGINARDMKLFVMSRINLCLMNLGLEPHNNVESNPIADWFYKGINNFQFNDFFSGIGREYQRDWESTGFIWRTKEQMEAMT